MSSYAALKSMLAERGLTVAQILTAAGVGRTHGIQVLKGTRPGPESRAAIKRQLTPREILALGWKCDRGQTRIEATGTYDFVASLDYPNAPGVDRLVQIFVADMTRLAEANKSKGVVWERRDG